MGEMARVLHLVESGGVYGAEQVILNLSEEMVLQGTYTPVIGSLVQGTAEKPELYEYARRRGLNTITVRVRNALMPVDALIAGTELRRRGIDLIHAHGYKPAVVGYQIQLTHRIPVIATCHLWFAGSRPPLKYRVMTLVERRAYRRFRRVVAVSSPIKQKLVGWGVAADRVEIIRNGIPVPRFAAINEDAVVRTRAELGLPDTGRLIVNVGRLDEQKNQEVLIRVIELIRKRGIDAYLAIVGEGPLHQALADSIASRGMDRAVYLLGFREDIGELLQCADVFALPSIDEGLPISLLEAMSVGVPVVVSAVGDVPAVIRHGVNGLLIDAGDVAGTADAIVRMLTDCGFAMSCGKRAVETITEGYSSGQMYEQYKRVYEECLDSRANRAG